MFQVEFPQLSKTILETLMYHNKNVLYDSNLLVSVSKFGIDTTKNRWYRIGIIPVSHRFEKAGIAHPYQPEDGVNLLLTVMKTSFSKFDIHFAPKTTSSILSIELTIDIQLCGREVTTSSTDREISQIILATYLISKKCYFSLV